MNYLNPMFWLYLIGTFWSDGTRTLVSSSQELKRSLSRDYQEFLEEGLAQKAQEGDLTLISVEEGKLTLALRAELSMAEDQS